MTGIATQAGHWYDRDGTPAYTIVGANGKERPTTIKDARKHGYVPSVTEILKTINKPGLNEWKIRQMMMAALTLPRLDHEHDEEFIKRLLEDSREEGRKAAERGTELHTEIERFISGDFYDHKFIPHITNLKNTLGQLGIELNGETEHSFCHKILRYGGKIDFSSLNVILDFKSKESITEKVKAYDEHAMQLAAYSHGIFGTTVGVRALNVFIGVNDHKIFTHEWTEDDLDKGWRQFQAIFEFWRLAHDWTL